MKMKKFVFGLLAVVTLLAFTAEAYSNSNEDQSTEQGIRKDKIRSKPQKR